MPTPCGRKDRKLRQWSLPCCLQLQQYHMGRKTGGGLQVLQLRARERQSDSRQGISPQPGVPPPRPAVPFDTLRMGTALLSIFESIRGQPGQHQPPISPLRSPAPSGVMYSMTPAPPLSCAPADARHSARCRTVRQCATSAAPSLPPPSTSRCQAASTSACGGVARDVASIGLA